jgi:hypothetical protein
VVEVDEEDSFKDSSGIRFDDHGHSQQNPQKDESWDLASRYRDIQRVGYLEEKQKKQLSLQAIQGVIERAKLSLGPVQKPYRYLTVTSEELESMGGVDTSPELDIEESWMNRQNPVYQIKLPREHGLVLVLDTSLSMKGEKLALLGATVAAVAMSVPNDALSILGFDAQIHSIKKFKESLSLYELVERVLSIPPGGFTNISKGLMEAREWIVSSKFTQARVILISDGRYTEGLDPVQVSKLLPFVYPVKIGKDPVGREVMRSISDTGLGEFMEVREMKELPSLLLRAIRKWVK